MREEKRKEKNRVKVWECSTSFRPCSPHNHPSSVRPKVRWHGRQRHGHRTCTDESLPHPPTQTPSNQSLTQQQHTTRTRLERARKTRKPTKSCFPNCDHAVSL